MITLVKVNLTEDLTSVQVCDDVISCRYDVALTDYSSRGYKFSPLRPAFPGYTSIVNVTSRHYTQYSIGGGVLRGQIIMQKSGKYGITAGPIGTKLCAHNYADGSGNGHRLKNIGPVRYQGKHF